MLKFHPSLPFPILDPNSHSHAEAKAHAAKADAWLGLQTARIEKQLAEHGCRNRPSESSGERQELWFGLDPQALLTPYTEIRYLLEKLQVHPGQTVIDLGAGYGRMGFVIGRHYPGVKFIGYEYVGERVVEARRCFERAGYTQATMRHVDLSASIFVPDVAQIYFLYDFGNLKAIEKTLHDLRRMSRAREVTLVARGRHCRYLIDRSHPWLKRAEPNEGESRVSIYRTYREMATSPAL